MKVRRDHILGGVRLTQAERAALDAMARREGVKAGAVLRRLLADEARRRGLRLVADEAATPAKGAA